MKQLSVSIIIPVYNVEKYVAKCLDSIIENNAFSGQVICVNDGSTDGSLEILNQYVAKYPNLEILSQPNAGLSEARNTGLRAAKGEYVMFIDSDDWVVSGSLAELFARIEGEEVLYYNGKRYFEEAQQYEKECPITEYKHENGQAFFASIMRMRRNIPWVCVWGAIYKRTFLIDNSLWNEPGIYHEDSYFTPQVLIKAKDVSCVDIDVYAYRIRGGSITAVVKPKNIQDALYVNRSLYKIYASYASIDKSFYSYVMDLYIGIIKDAGNSQMNLSQWWRKEDHDIMKHCVYNDRTRKIYRLSRMSFAAAYLYCIDRLPSVPRKLVNRFL